MKMMRGQVQCQGFWRRNHLSLFREWFKSHKDFKDQNFTAAVVNSLGSASVRAIPSVFNLVRFCSTGQCSTIVFPFYSLPITPN